MRIWSVANQKGGVGKTTTSVTLGGVCAAAGARTLLLDLDPHGSMTAYFGYDPESIDSSIYDLFKSETLSREAIVALVRGTSIDNMDLLPASMALATLDRQLGAKGGMGLTIAKALKVLAHEYDHAIIDCPPMLGVLMVNALAACDHLIIPVQTEFLAIKGLERMQNTLQMIERSRGMHIPYTIVPTMFDRRTRASIDSLQHLRDKFGEHLWDAVIPIDTRFREASRVGKPLSQFLASSRGAQAYYELQRYLMGEESQASRVIAL